MTDAIALANNDVAQIVWRYKQPIKKCLGFEISRQEGSAAPNGKWVPLPAWVGFKGEKIRTGLRRPQRCGRFRSLGKDLTATRGKIYGYRIVPMVGVPDNLQPQTNQTLYTNIVTLTPKRGSFFTYFNRGILSTQYVAHQIKPVPRRQIIKLQNQIDQPGDPLRNTLAGQIIEGVESLLQRAEDEGGACYAALYELNDPELVKRLLGMNNDQLHLILSNTGPSDATERLHARHCTTMVQTSPTGFFQAAILVTTNSLSTLDGIIHRRQCCLAARIGLTPLSVPNPTMH